MLMIRFQRVGRKNDPAFRIVVTEKRSKPKSGEIEILGSHHPKTKETVLKNERILYWLSKGAHASPTVHNLLISKNIIEGTKINVVPPPPKAATAEEGPAAVEESVSVNEEGAKEKENTKEKSAEDMVSSPLPSENPLNGEEENKARG